MPTVYREAGFRFFFYSDDHTPIHIHVKKGGALARIVLEPEITIDLNHGFKAQELKKVITIITKNYDHLINAWNETFNQ